MTRFTARNDVWAQGAGYERYVGRWSRLVAAEFLKWIAIPPGKTWLDLGWHNVPTKVVGVDPSEGFISHAKAQITDKRGISRGGCACIAGR